MEGWTSEKSARILLRIGAALHKAQVAELITAEDGAWVLSRAAMGCIEEDQDIRTLLKPGALKVSAEEAVAAAILDKELAFVLDK